MRRAVTTDDGGVPLPRRLPLRRAQSAPQAAAAFVSSSSQGRDIFQVALSGVVRGGGGGGSGVCAAYMYARSNLPRARRRWPSKTDRQLMAALVSKYWREAKGHVVVVRGERKTTAVEEEILTDSLGGSGGAMDEVQPHIINAFERPTGRGGHGGGAIELVAHNDVTIGSHGAVIADIEQLRRLRSGKLLDGPPILVRTIERVEARKRAVESDIARIDDEVLLHADTDELVWVPNALRSLTAFDRLEHSRQGYTCFAVRGGVCVVTGGELFAPEGLLTERSRELRKKHRSRMKQKHRQIEAELAALTVTMSKERKKQAWNLELSLCRRRAAADQREERAICKAQAALADAQAALKAAKSVRRGGNLGATCRRETEMALERLRASKDVGGPCAASCCCEAALMLQLGQWRRVIDFVNVSLHTHVELNIAVPAKRAGRTTVLDRRATTRSWQTCRLEELQARAFLQSGDVDGCVASVQGALSTGGLPTACAKSMRALMWKATKGRRSSVICTFIFRKFFVWTGLLSASELVAAATTCNGWLDAVGAFANRVSEFDKSMPLWACFPSQTYTGVQLLEVHRIQERARAAAVRESLVEAHHEAKTAALCSFQWKMQQRARSKRAKQAERWRLAAGMQRQMQRLQEEDAPGGFFIERKECGHLCENSDFVNLCCACADTRAAEGGHAYRIYVDGFGFSKQGTRRMHYCPTCSGVRDEQTKKNTARYK